MQKRLFAALLCAILVMALLPTAALADGSVITDKGLDLSSSWPALVTTYKAGGGTVTWDPIVYPATLTFEDATIAVAPGTKTVAVALPDLVGGVNVVFKGINSITPSVSNAVAIDCKGSTIINLMADSHTDLSARSGSDSFVGIRIEEAPAGSTLKIIGSGRLDTTPNDAPSPLSIATASSSTDHQVILDGGTLVFSGEVTGAVTLGGVTIPSGKNLDLKWAGSVAKGTTGAVINGELRLPKGTSLDDINDLGLTGSGTVMISETSCIYLGGKWVCDGGDFPPSAGFLNLGELPINIATVYKAGSGTVLWEPTLGSTGELTAGKLTLNSATIQYTIVGSTVFKMPDVPVEIELVGANSISHSVPFTVFYRCDNQKPITMTGAGTIDVTASAGYTATLIDNGGQNVTLNDGERWGEIKAANVTLTDVTIPANRTLNLAGVLGTLTVANTVNNGILVLKTGTTAGDVKALDLPGDGIVKIDEQYYTNSGDEIFQSGALSFEDSDSVNNGIKASDAKLATHGYEFTKEGSGYTLTLGNLIIDAEGTGIHLQTGTSVTVALAAVATTRIISDGSGIVFAAADSATNTINGSGKLIIISKGGLDKPAISTSNRLIIADGDISITNTTGIGIDASAAHLTIGGGRLNITAEGGAIFASSLDLVNSMMITEPTGAVVGRVTDGESDTILYDSAPATSVIIQPAPVYDDDDDDDEVYTPSPVTVYNDPSVQDATVWLTGNGLSGSDLLITERDPSGSEYEALLKQADFDDVFKAYNIYLRSGQKSTGSAMHLTFNLNEKYAGDDFTLVHQKADGTYEYSYDTADANGDLTFGPLYELSPFMLVKGTLLPKGAGLPQTGDDAQPMLWAGIGLMLAAVSLAGFVTGKRGRKRSKA